MRNISWIAVIALCTVTGSTLGQNLVNFANCGQRVNAPFYDSHGTLLSGTNYMAQLYAGATADALFAIARPVPFLTGVLAGYCGGGAVALPNYLVGGYCGPAWVQVRAWEASGGYTFEQAALSGYWTGISSLLYLPGTGGCGGGVPGPPVDLIGLRYPGNPIIVQEPLNERLRPGEDGYLWIVASGGTAVSYQWYSGASGDTNTPIAGATNLFYYRANLSTNVTFWVRVTTSTGFVDSATATMWIVPSIPGPLSAGLASAVPELTIQGSSNNYGEVQLQFTPNPNPPHWTALTNLWQDLNPVTFVDTTATNFSTRFYRLALP